MDSVDVENIKHLLIQQSSDSAPQNRPSKLFTNYQEINMNMFLPALLLIQNLEITQMPINDQIDKLDIV